MQATTIQPEFVPRSQAAAFVGKSDSWFRREELFGRPPVPRYRVGKTAVYKISDLREYMASRVEVSAVQNA